MSGRILWKEGELDFCHSHIGILKLDPVLLVVATLLLFPPCPKSMMHPYRSVPTIHGRMTRRFRTYLEDCLITLNTLLHRQNHRRLRKRRRVKDKLILLLDRLGLEFQHRHRTTLQAAALSRSQQQKRNVRRILGTSIYRNIGQLSQNLQRRLKKLCTRRE
jgi:hypothetical protein